MSEVRLVLVGGFLGAGKTTLLKQAARRLIDRGRRVGLITNDQAPNLVDTKILLGEGLPVGEISGGCFCCRFEDLIGRLDRLVDDSRPEVIFAEPVGSCTDLSATVLQPLKRSYADRFRVAPFSVLVDPLRRPHSTDPSESAMAAFPESVRHIYTSQLQEADLIVVNKADALSAEELQQRKAGLADGFPDTPILEISALHGQGIDAWLDAVLQDTPGGQTIAEVDYDVYAAGEAALGWLNATVELEPNGQIDWPTFCLDFVRRMRDALRQRSAEVAHLKIHLSGDGGALQANLTANAAEPTLQAIGPTPSGSHKASLIINARVHLDPIELRGVVEQSLTATSGDHVRAQITTMESFTPGRPEPVHRMDRVV